MIVVEFTILYIIYLLPVFVFMYPIWSRWQYLLHRNGSQWGNWYQASVLPRGSYRGLLLQATGTVTRKIMNIFIYGRRHSGTAWTDIIWSKLDHAGTYKLKCTFWLQHQNYGARIWDKHECLQLKAKHRYLTRKGKGWYHCNDLATDCKPTRDIGVFADNKEYNNICCCYIDVY